MSFVWYELVTPDIDKALAFYGKVIGWQGREFTGGPDRYVIAEMNGKGVGGMMTSDECPGTFWVGYLGTNDIGASTTSLSAAGARIERGPSEIPDVGKIALISDPQGVGFALIQDASGQPSGAMDPMQPGHGAWHELHTPDPEAAFAFYSGQFGWTKDIAMDMGPMGMYQIFKAGDMQIGGMMRAMDGVPPSWLFYFATDSINAAVSRIQDAGGQILRDPTEVPGGLWIVQAKDPMGAVFALVGHP